MGNKSYHCLMMKKAGEWIKKMYSGYKDFFPADLWALLIMILMFVLGFLYLYFSG